MPKLGFHRYGKSRVRVMKVAREGARHTVHDLDVDVSLGGRFEATHLTGDNRDVVPTDTMKNTIYALAHDHEFGSIEGFGIRLGTHFLSRDAPVDTVGVRIRGGAWRRIRTESGPHEHAFLRSKREARGCDVRVDRSGTRVSASIRKLELLKTTRSAFREFFHDEFTTLQDASDRVLATSVTAKWDYDPLPEDFDVAWTSVREALVTTFADHDSLSVQHTLYAMGCAALAACDEAARIHLVLPNRHCLWVDLEAFGCANENVIFRPVDEPYGRIEAVVER
jgi:urate oxidase